MRRALWFLLMSAPMFGADQYTLSLYGGSTVYQGYDLWVRIGIHYTGTVSGVWLDYGGVSMSGLDATMTADVICMNGSLDRPECWAGTGGRKYLYNTSSNPAALNIRIKTRTSTPPGKYTVTLHTESKAAPGEITMSIPITVAATPSLPVKSPVPSPPVIPNLASWEDTMLTLGDKWCKHQTACSPGGADCSISPGGEGQVWYYDGARVYFQVADYTGDKATWEPCAYYYADQYRAHIFVHPQEGWEVFPHGQGMAYQRSSNMVYKDAVTRLATGTQWSGNPQTSDVYIREDSYALQSYIWDQTVSGSYNSQLNEAVSKMLGWVDPYFVNRSNFLFHQQFYDGLWAQALIDYFEWTKARNSHQRLDDSGNWVDVPGADPRIPIAIKAMLDWTWEDAWDNVAKNMAFNAIHTPNHTDPPYCGQWNIECCGTQSSCSSRTNQLLMLTAPAYAWYYNLTGDSTYQVRGDTIWASTPRAMYATVSAADDTLTTRVPHGLSTGDHVEPGRLVDAMPSGIGEDRHYYAIVIDPYTIKLTSTPGGAPWNITGDGTCLLSTSWEGMGYSGKIFSQNYRWSFDYVRWRSMGKPTTPMENACDLDSSGMVDIVDVQSAINAVLGTSPCGAADLDHDGACTIIDVTRVINAARGRACNAGGSGK